MCVWVWVCMGVGICVQVCMGVCAGITILVTTAKELLWAGHNTTLCICHWCVCMCV